MRIAKFKVPPTISSQVKLGDINLTHKSLGTIVAFAGKNGAGKSRVLKLIEGFFQHFDKEMFKQNYLINISENLGGPPFSEVERLRKLIANSPNNKDQFINQLINAEDALFRRIRTIGPSFIKVVDNDDLKNIKASIDNNALSFTRIAGNAHTTTVQETVNRALSSNNTNNFAIPPHNEFTTFNSEDTLKYVQTLLDQYLLDEYNLYVRFKRDHDGLVAELSKKHSYHLFNKFIEYIKMFLGKTVSYKQTENSTQISGQILIDDEPFNLKLFSPGQKTLFAYAILFFYMEVNSNNNLKDCILIIDEPEKHLHPESQIQLLDALREMLSSSGQLIIATHSINILSHLNYDEIIGIRNNEIFKPSRTTPGDTFNELMGLQQHKSELSEFISSVTEWSYSRFMAQCFIEPDVIFSNNTNDPQYLQFKSFLNTLQTVSILDFGAGKGRFGHTVAEDTELSSKISYNAFEPNITNQKVCSSVPRIKAFYSNLSQIPDEAFDCVILCNVLHEIGLEHWEKSFNKIKNCLRENGVLIIMEDSDLPKGENAHEFGYLILNYGQIKTLFKENNSIAAFKVSDVRYADRLSFIIIPKDAIICNTQSIFNALSQLNSDSLAKIKSIRSNPENDTNIGRVYANQTQLYVNSTLALEFLKKELAAPFQANSN